MSEYRKIRFPKCPYCGKEVEPIIGSYDYGKLVSMANGTCSPNVVLKCDECSEEYRVTCNITFYARKEI